MSDYLEHHGIKGQRWGVRRYQNPDGSLTDAGKKKYGKNSKKYGMMYDYKHAKAYNKMKRGVEKGKLTQKQMNRGLKELGMSKTEIDLRDAQRNYNQTAAKSRYVGYFLGGPVGGLLAEVAVMNASPVGKEYTKRLSDTSLKYAQERAKYYAKQAR